MLVFNLHEDGDFITEEDILIDTSNKIRIIKDNIPYLKTLYNMNDILNVLTSYSMKGDK
jgi:hypothetical protein